MGAPVRSTSSGRLTPEEKAPAQVSDGRHAGRAHVVRAVGLGQALAKRGQRDGQVGEQHDVQEVLGHPAAREDGRRARAGWHVAAHDVQRDLVVAKKSRSYRSATVYRVFRVPNDDLPKAISVLPMVGGHIVYDANVINRR